LNTTDRQIREWVKGFHLVWDDLRQRAKETRQNNFAISPINVV